MKLLKNILIIVIIFMVVIPTASCNPYELWGKPKQTEVIIEAPTKSGSETPVVQPPAHEKRTPAKIGQMKAGEVFYKPEQTRSIDMVDVSGLDENYVASIRCLQGLVARESGASIYLNCGESDMFWINYIGGEYGLTFQKTDASALFAKYKSQINSVVFYNPKNIYEFPLALTYASIENGIAVTDELYEKIKEFLPAEHKTYSLKDKYADAGAAFSWAVQDLLVNCTKNYIGNVNKKTEFIDYLYATKSFCISLEPGSFSEFHIKELMGKDYYMPGILFSDMYDYASAASENGFSILNTNGFCNATFFSSFPVDSKNDTQPASVDRGANDDAIYISLIIESGGALNSAEDYFNYVETSPANLTTPVGIEINPALCELAPPVLSRMKALRTSSMGYISTAGGYAMTDYTAFSDRAFDGWISINEYLGAKSGIKTFTYTAKKQDDRLKRVCGYIGSGGFVMSGSDNNFLYENTSFIKAIKYESIDKMTDFKIKSEDGKPTFICIRISAEELNGNPKKTLEKLIENIQLGNDRTVEFLLPGDLMATFKGYFS